MKHRASHTGVKYWCSLCRKR